MQRSLLHTFHYEHTINGNVYCSVSRIFLGVINCGQDSCSRMNPAKKNSDSEHQLMWKERKERETKDWWCKLWTDANDICWYVNRRFLELFLVEYVVKICQSSIIVWLFFRHKLLIWNCLIFVFSVWQSSLPSTFF